MATVWKDCSAVLGRSGMGLGLPLLRPGGHGGEACKVRLGRIKRLRRHATEMSKRKAKHKQIQQGRIKPMDDKKALEILDKRREELDEEREVLRIRIEAKKE